jgi:hypothetical protein
MKRKPSAQGYNYTTLFLGGYKYGDLVPQVGGGSNERVLYSYWSFAALTSE